MLRIIGPIVYGPKKPPPAMPEDVQIRRYWTTYTLGGIARIIGRTAEFVSERGRVLGLPKRNPGRRAGYKRAAAAG